MCIHEIPSLNDGKVIAVHIDVLDLLVNLLAVHIDVLDLLANLLAYSCV
jgi:hypothetical protein